MSFHNFFFVPRNLRFFFKEKDQVRSMMYDELRDCLLIGCFHVNMKWSLVIKHITSLTSGGINALHHAGAQTFI